MSILILYTDLRILPSILQKAEVEWCKGLSAFDAVRQSFGSKVANDIQQDLIRNNTELIVAWYNKASGDICEIGGVGTLDWVIDDYTLLTITYENANTTEEQIAEADQWTLENDILKYEGYP
ncbi:MAG: hypothetical protein JXJ17_19775 [Anaerolineae bacterium]|nr:hypothetical protein [Anaerolineae bacterium]